MDTALATATAAVVVASPSTVVLNQSNNSVGSVGSNSSSSGSSSASSGYGSATTTPTTPLSNHYDNASHASPTTNAATVATVAPFFSEALLADAVQLQQQRQQQQQQHNHHLHQQQQQQQQQHPQFQQQQQQQQQQQPHYFQSYSYATTTTGNAVSTIPGLSVAPQLDYNGYNAYSAAGTYQSNPPINRSEKLSMSSSTNSISNISNNINGSGNNFAKSYTLPQQSGSGKPQAAATPFYAQPLYGNPSSGASGIVGQANPAYYDAYKYKKITQTAPDYATYGSYASVYGQSQTQSLHQQQLQPHHHQQTQQQQHLQQQQQQQQQQQHQPQQPQQYFTQKPQLSEANYAAVRPNARGHATVPMYGAVGNGAPSPYYDAKYDKYGLYTPNVSSVGAYGGTVQPSAHYPHGPPLVNTHYASPPEISVETPYRKSNSCHWNLDYSTGNCRAIPPPHAAAVPPSHGHHSYQTTAQHLGSTQVNGGDLYFEKFGKYEKYSSPLSLPSSAVAPQVAVATGAVAAPSPYGPQYAPRQIWSGSFSGVQENTLPMSAVANPRPNCCPQLITPQQSCYYPRSTGYGSNGPPPFSNPTQPSQYVTNAAKLNEYPPLHNGGNSNSSKLKHPPNDLYISSPYEASVPAASHLGYNYASSNPVGSGNSSGQRYQQISSGPVAAIEPTVPTPTAYYNDLNIGNLDTTYTSTHLHQQQSTGPPRSQCKPSLIDYRKPQTNCYVPQISPLTNLEAQVENYATASYQLTPPDLSNSYYLPNLSPNQNVVNQRENTPKNLSIRDFLSSWNDDEEEALANEDPAGLLLPSPEQQVLAEPPSLPINYEMTVTLKDDPVHKSLDAISKVQVGIAVSSGDLGVDVNQYMNLPDIIIDIEKSSNGATAAAAPLPAIADDSFGSFDVEKELDELRLASNQIVSNQSGIEEPEKVLEEMLGEPSADFVCQEKPSVTETVTDELLAVEKTEEPAKREEFDKTEESTELSATESEVTEPSAAELTAKDIEEDDCNSTHSNGSSFEQAYESFIKNGSSNSGLTDKSPEAEAAPKNDDPSIEMTSASTQDDMEYKQHLKKFSKFYKRKRKLTESSDESPEELNAIKSPKIVMENKLQISTAIKKPLKRTGSWLRSLRERYNPSNRVQLHCYFKILRIIRRRFSSMIFKPRTSELLERFLAQRKAQYLAQVKRQKKELHLPLIKRQSIKQYLYNPQSLKLLSVSYINSDAFRRNILLPVRTETVIKTVYEAKCQSFAEGCVDLTMEMSPKEVQSAEISDVADVDVAKDDVADVDVVAKDDVADDDVANETELEKTEQTALPKTEIREHDNNDDEEKGPTEITHPLQQQIEEICVEGESESLNINCNDLPSPAGIPSIPSIEQMESFKGFEDDEVSEGLELNTTQVDGMDENAMPGIYGECRRMKAEHKDCSSSKDVNGVDASKETTTTTTTGKCDILDMKSIKKLEIQEWLNKNIEADCIEESEVTVIEREKILEPIDERNNHTPIDRPMTTDFDNENTTKKAHLSSSSSDDSDSGDNSSTSDSESSSSSSSSSSEDSDFNELAALEKELSQHPNNEEFTQDVTPNQIKSDLSLTDNAISNNDIANLKKILESDGEEAAQDTNQTSVNANPSNVAEADLKLPKLSDLCKIALNSSLQTNELVINNTRETPEQPTAAGESERELSVEEKLAEMYQQIGVASDPEDYDEGKLVESSTQDVLLINLADIFENSSDLLVLQCDMNENILSVVASDSGDADNGEGIIGNAVAEAINNHHNDQANDIQDAGTETESVNALQLFEILNANEGEDAHGEYPIDNRSSLFEIVNSGPQNVILPEILTSESGNHLVCVAGENSSSTQFELPAIHHEEIVPDNYKEFEKRKFIKYLHEKYVQQRITKFYHANCVLKKYKRRLIRESQKFYKSFNHF